MKSAVLKAAAVASVVVVLFLAYAWYGADSVSPYCPENAEELYDQNKIQKIFSPNQTSASFLMGYYKLQTCLTHGDGDYLVRFSVVYDLYIKARSYAILNKVFFWMACFSAIVVFLWPSLSVVAKEYGKEIKLLSSAIVQTTVTGVAALTFAFYSHYKEMQMSTENLMRYVIYSKNDDVEAIAEKVIKEMEKIDTGFSFSWVTTDQEQK